MSDGSSKALRVDQGQTVGDVLEVLLEKTHCDGSEDWCLVETQHQLQTGETQLVGSELEEAVAKVLQASSQHLMFKCVVLYVSSQISVPDFEMNDNIIYYVNIYLQRNFRLGPSANHVDQIYICTLFLPLSCTFPWKCKAKGQEDRCFGELGKHFGTKKSAETRIWS